MAVTQIVEHPSLDAVRDGLKDELGNLGYREGQTLAWTWQTAQGNPATAAQIARQFAGAKPEVVVGISTPSAQAIAAAAPQIPLVFTAVTDPVAAKLVPSLEKPGGMITGVSDLTPIAKHLDLIQQITPQVKRLGVLYNAGEANSVALVALLKQAAPARQLNLVEATATNSGGVSSAAQSLVGKVDAIYVPTDNTIASALEAVLKVGIDNKVPVYAGDSDSVKRGAIATLSFDYLALGRDTARIVDRILKGEKPGSIPVVTPSQLDLAVNLKSAELMGVQVPDSLVKQAKNVIR